MAGPRDPRSPDRARRRVLLEWLLVAALAAASPAAIIRTGALQRLDGMAYDGLARLAGRRVDPSIILVAIDDRSLAALGRWPWSRARHAALVDRIAAARPRALAFDILFSEPESPSADTRFAAAIARAGRVFLPTAGAPGGADALAPAGAIEAAAAGLGEVSVRPDPDGVVRRFERCAGRFATLMEAVARSSRPPPPAAAGCADELIPFAAGPGRYRAISYVSVLRGEAPAEVFKDHIVLVGATATGMSDRFLTPMDGGGGMSGLELQADILDALVNDRRRREAGFWPTLLFSWAPLAALLAGFRFLSPAATAWLGGGLAVLTAAASAALLTLAGWWISPVTPLAVMMLVFPLWGWRRLAGASDYLGAEFSRLRDRLADGEPGQTPPHAARAERVTQQALELAEAIDRIDALRRFSDDILAALPDPTLVTDPHGRVIKANLAAEQFFGGPHALVGASVVEVLLSLGPRQAGDAEAWRPDAQTAPLRLELADGRTLQVQTALRGEPGALEGAVVRVADVTALVATARQREQALQLLTHDMRSPLTSILILLDQQPRPDAEAGVSARIAANARRTLALADGFVQFARAEAAPLALTPVDVGDAISEAVDALWPQAQQKHITLAQEGCDAPRLTLGDQALLARVFGNLFGNAVKYGPPGSTVAIRLSASPPGHRGRLLVEVRDQGPGFTSEEAAQAFDPFQRFVRAGGASGAGLGLAFVRSVILRHGGQVWCESRPGEGAVFFVNLAEWVEPDAAAGD
jgi:CHASE2 domain-containing sensor protein/signal transduction histidine kinase